jgi:hypothetical protein
MVTLALSFQGVGLDHRDKTRVQMAAKMFPHFEVIMLAVYCSQFLVLTQSKETVFVIKFGIFYNTNKILTILVIVKYEKITLQ